MDRTCYDNYHNKRGTLSSLYEQYQEGMDNNYCFKGKYPSPGVDHIEDESGLMLGMCALNVDGQDKLYLGFTASLTTNLDTSKTQATIICKEPPRTKEIEETLKGGGVQKPLMNLRVDQATTLDEYISDMTQIDCEKYPAGSERRNICDNEIEEDIKNCVSGVDKKGNPVAKSGVSDVEKCLLDQGVDSATIAAYKEKLKTIEGIQQATKCEQGLAEFAWFVCPAADKSLSIGGEMYNQALNLLFQYNIVNSQTSSNNSGNQTGQSSLYSIWSQFVPIGNVTLAIVFLILIYSIATSSVLSNYSVKKILPRLIVAAIAINLSFYICAAAVDISNIIGANIAKFLAPPDITWWQSIEDILVGVAGFAAIALAVFLGLMSGGMVFLALIAFVGLVVLRSALITLLIAISPIAFSLYLLPNTKKWFDMYIKEFSRLLIAYPLIAGVFGAAMLTDSVLSTTNIWWIGLIVKPMLMIVPLLAVFPILKTSGNALSTVTATASRLGKQMKERYNKTDVGQARNAYKSDKRALRMAGLATTKTNKKGKIKKTPWNMISAANNKMASIGNPLLDRFAPGYNSTVQLNATNAQNRKYKQTEELMTAKNFSQDELMNMINTGKDKSGRVISEEELQVAIKLSADLMTGSELQKLITQSKKFSDDARRAVSDAIAKNSGKIPFAGGGQIPKIASGTYDEKTAMNDFVAKRANATNVTGMDSDMQKALFDHINSSGDPNQKAQLNDVLKGITQNTWNNTSGTNRQQIREQLGDPNFSGAVQEVVLNHGGNLAPNSSTSSGGSNSISTVNTRSVGSSNPTAPPGNANFGKSIRPGRKP